MRFAILGLYNSGSPALAGMLYRLEADDLAAALRRWCDEPALIGQSRLWDAIDAFAGPVTLRSAEKLVERGLISL